MASTCPATYSAPFDQRPLTPVPLLVCGDKIACLEHLPALDSDSQVALARRRAHALVIGIHLPDADHIRKALKSQLRNAHDILNTHLRRHPLVRHVIYVVHLDPDLGPADMAVRLLFATASAHHAEIEMRHGRDICVTGIGASTHTSAEALAKRVNDRMRTAPFEGSYATSWDEIEDRSITAAAAEELL